MAMDNLDRCSEVTGLLVFYRFGELAPDKAALVETHLDGCENCRAELAEIDLTLEYARPEPVPNATAQAAAAKVMARISTPAARPALLRLAPIFAAIAILAGAATLYFTGYVGVAPEAPRTASVETDDVDIELLENYDLLANMDVLEDMDTLETMAEL